VDLLLIKLLLEELMNSAQVILWVFFGSLFCVEERSVKKGVEVRGEQCLRVLESALI